jgi:hypothetical protein
MANQIIAENQLSGTSASVWDIGIGGGSNTIEGFATDISVNRGQTVSFKINTVATKYWPTTPILAASLFRSLASLPVPMGQSPGARVPLQ